MFRDRIEAGKILAQAIKEKGWSLFRKDSIILALPRGGIIVAAEVAKALDLPLDIIVTRKIGAPLNPEYALAAVGENALVLNPNEVIDEKYIEAESKKERAEIKRRLEEYRGKKEKPELSKKKVILIDDGLATGLTMEVAIQEVKTFNPQKIILAVPVAPPETAEKLSSLVNAQIILKIEPIFFAIGQFYQNFPQVSDEEVKDILNSFGFEAK